MIIETKEYTLSQIADKLNLTYQAVYVAMKANKLIGFKKVHATGRKKWTITEDAIKKWMEAKYKRTRGCKEDGTYVYDAQKNQFSTSQIAQKFRVPIGRLYYLIKKGKLPFTKHKAYYILTVDDMDKLKHLLRSYDYKKPTPMKD